MMTLLYKPLPTAVVRALQAGGPDTYGFAPERAISDGDGVPCRHCLTNVGVGEPYLILAFRPFPQLQSFAETGPIFLHADPCRQAGDSGVLPDLFTRSVDHFLRGYGADDRIVYGTGAVVPSAEIPARAQRLLARPDVAYVHMRSARNNCYECRIERS